MTPYPHQNSEPSKEASLFFIALVAPPSLSALKISPLSCINKVVSSGEKR